ncbi:MAG: cyclic nucleotide-binding domain-containing protein [Burkholderiaceae bacterium]
MKEIPDLLREHLFTQGLDDYIVEAIAGCARNVSFDAGEYVFREGGEARFFYLIRRGHVALEMFAPGRGPVTFISLKSGDLLGVSWLLPPYRWGYDARTVASTQAIAFDAQCLRQKCEADHHLGYEMMKRFIGPLAQRLHSARLQSADLFSQSGSP